MDIKSHSELSRTSAAWEPFRQIEATLLANQYPIEEWFRSKWRSTPAPFYGSIDLRNSGTKLSPVDMNFFPAGFNNLPPSSRRLCVHAIQHELERWGSSIKTVILVPENHTRNLNYYENLGMLASLFTQAGFTLRIGSMLPDLHKPQPILLSTGQTLILEPLQRTGDKVHVDDFVSDFVLLNNDLSAGRPVMLEAISQPMAPPLHMGWSNRLKSDHFRHYRDIATEFAEFINIDPWLIDPIFRYCDKIDFHTRSGEDCLVENVAAVLEDVRTKYNEYGIHREPFVIVKADSGTYGMAIMTVRHPHEALSLSRRDRNKMARTKDGRTVGRVLVQEGIHTSETSNGAYAEPVVYTIGRSVVGVFYRVHAERRFDENLNAPGMHFESPTLSTLSGASESPCRTDEAQSRIYAYGVVARLSLLAGANEIFKASNRGS